MRPGCARGAAVVGAVAVDVAVRGPPVGGVAEVLAVDGETAGSPRGFEDEQAVRAVATRHPARRPVPQGSRRTDTSQSGLHQHRTGANADGRAGGRTRGDALGVLLRHVALPSLGTCRACTWPPGAR